MSSVPPRPPRPAERGLLWKALDGVAFGFFGETFAGVASLLASLVVLRALSVHQFGLWQLAISLLALVNTLSFSSMDRLVVAELSRLKGERRGEDQYALFVGYARSILAMGTGIGILYAAVALPRARGGSEFALAVLILASTLPLGTVKRVLSTFFSAELTFHAVSLMGAIEAVSYLLLVFWGAVVMHLGLLGVAVAYAGAMAVSTVVLLPTFLRRLKRARIQGRGSASMQQFLRSYGLWSVGAHIVESLSANAKPWILARFLGVEALGLFAFARTLVSQIAAVIPVPRVLNALLPHEFRDPERFSVVTWRALKYSLWIGLLAAGAAAIVAYFLVQLILPKYASAMPLFYLMLPVIVIGSMTFVFINVLYAARLQRQFFFGTMFKPISSFLVLPALLWTLGLWGAAIEYVLLALVMLWLRYYPIRSHLALHRESWTALFAFDRVDRLQFARVQQWMRSRFRVFGPSR